jgi:hypothetical protein
MPIKITNSNGRVKINGYVQGNLYYPKTDLYIGDYGDTVTIYRGKEVICAGKYTDFVNASDAAFTDLPTCLAYLLPLLEPSSAGGGGSAVSVSNFPAVQAITGNVGVSNFPAVQAVGVTNFPAVQPVNGSVGVSNLPTSYPLPNNQEAILAKIRDKRELMHEIQSTGLIEGKTAFLFQILGRRSNWADAATMHDLCEFLTTTAGQQTFIPVTTADQLDIVSTSANDTSAGTGTRTVEVTYLDASGNIQITTVTLNGTTAVPLTGIAATAILWMEAVTGGALEVSQGTISLRKVGAPTTIYEQIVAGGNKSMSGRFRVPTGYTAYLVAWDGFAINQTMDIRLRATVKTLDRTVSTRYVFQDNMFLATSSNSTRPMPFLKYPAGATIKISAQAGATGGTPRCDASFTVIIIQN